MIKKKHIYFFILIVCLSYSVVKSQPYSSIYRLDTRINGLVPHPLYSKAFANTFTGIYTVSGSENIQLFNNFYAGVSGGNSLYKVPTNKAVSTIITVHGYSLTDLLQLNSVGLNLGYDYYFSPKAFLSSSIAVGQDFAKFTNVQTYSPVPVNNKFNAGFIQLTSNINWILEDHMGIGFLISYTRINYSFNPYDIALNQFKPYTDGDLKGVMNIFEVGFNVYLGYVKKKK